MSEKQIVISFGNKLPLASDVVRSVVSVAPTFNSEKQKRVVKSAIESVFELWENIFPADCLITKNCMGKRLQKFFQKYDLMRKHRENQKSESFLLSLEYLFDILAKGVEIGDDALREFYEDQKGPRKMFIHNDQIMDDMDSDESLEPSNIEDQVYSYFYSGNLILQYFLK